MSGLNPLSGLQPAIAFTSGIFPTAALDVVAVYDEDFIQVFRNARPLKLTIRPTVTPMTQPLESGATIVDHRIINQLNAELSLIFKQNDYRDVYNEIWELKNKSTLLIVQCYAKTFENLFIVDMSHDETVDMHNTLAMSLKLIEKQTSTATVTKIPRSPSNSNTKNRGQIQPTEPPPKKTSAAVDLFG